MSRTCHHLAWVLHYRPYKETSVIADLLTQNIGKVSVVASGVRRQFKKKSSNKQLQPFSQLQCSWRGKTELKTLVKTDTEKVVRLKGPYLLSGLYVNELLIRLLYPLAPVEGLWELYSSLMQALARESALEYNLRLFEKKLLTLLGYEIPLSFVAGDGQAVHPDRHYVYTPQGFVGEQGSTTEKVFKGKVLLNYANNHITEEMLPELKTLNRLVLADVLGGRPLNSRTLFRKYS